MKMHMNTAGCVSVTFSLALKPRVKAEVMCKQIRSRQRRGEAIRAGWRVLKCDTKTNSPILH